MSDDVVVVGSLNRDLRIEVRRRPRPGETLVVDAVAWSNGGKGGNQAVAAARAGASVRMVGAVGEDAEGASQLDELRAFGVDVAGVRRVLGRPTGTAFIVLTPDGENSILVHAGANGLVDPGSPALYRGVRVAIVQTEVGVAIAEAAAEAARAADARLVVNAAPVVPLGSALYRDADPLVVNEHEMAELLGSPPGDPRTGVAELRRRAAARSVVVTLGAAGGVVADHAGTVRVPAVPAGRVVDTTGAGDTFVGTLAARLALGEELRQAVGVAAEAATRSVESKGARPDPGVPHTATPPPVTASSSSASPARA